MDLWQTLAQFVFRLALGIAVSMAITSPKQVQSGFFRVHLWVLLGLLTFAALAVYSARESVSNWQTVTVLATVGAVVSYVGSILWLYDRTLGGKLSLWMVALLSLNAICFSAGFDRADSLIASSLRGLDLITGSMVLGTTMTAMLLGHWYLNSPGMKLAPLRRLVLAMGIALIARAVVNGVGLGLEASAATDISMSWWLFVSLRWLAGILGALLLAVLTWKTLDVPNTQSATGILYAGVIVVFIGELTSQLLTVNATYPV